MRRGAGGLARTLCPNVCDTPTAQFGHVAQVDMACRKQTVEELRSRGVEGRIQELGSDGDGLSLLDSQLSTSRLAFGGTKRECL